MTEVVEAIIGQTSLVEVYKDQATVVVDQKQGPPGPAGPTGPPGPQGSTGPAGPPGAAGKGLEWIYQVEDYGADGTGSTDALAALDATLAACPAGGSIVFNPVGVYVVNGTWTINKAVRVFLNGATVKCAYTGVTGNTPLIKVTAAGVRFDGGGGILDGDRLNRPNGGPCLWTAHASGVVKVRNLICKSAAFHGIYQELAGGTLDLRGIESYDHKDNAAANNANGVRVAAGVLRMVDYYGHDNDMWALSISGNGAGHHIEGFRSRHNASGGFWITGGTGQIVGAASYDDRNMSFMFENVHDWQATGLESSYQGNALDGNYSDGLGPNQAGTGLQITNCYSIQADVKIARALGYGIALGSNCYECTIRGDCERNGDPDFTLSSGSHHNVLTGTSMYGTCALSIGEARGDCHHNDIDLIVVGAGQGALEGNVGSYNDITLRCRDCRIYDITLGAGLLHMWGDSFNNNTVTLITEHADLDYGVETTPCTVTTAAGGPNSATIDNTGHTWVANQWVGYAALWKTGANAGTIRRISQVTINSPDSTHHVLSFDAVPAGTPTPANAQPGDTLIIIPSCKYLVDFKDRAYNNYPAVARQTDSTVGQIGPGTYVYAVTVVGPGYEVPVTPQLPTAGGASSGVVTVDATHTSVLIGTMSVGAGGGLPLGRRNSTGRKIYRSKANTTTPLFLVATVDNTVNGYVDRIPDASLGAQTLPALGTMYTAWGNRVVSMDVAPESYIDAVIRDVTPTLNPLVNTGRLTRTRRVTGTVANAGSYAPNLSVARLFALTFNGATATLAAPTWGAGAAEGDEFSVEVFNNTAGALTLTVTAYTWPTAFVAPAAGKRKLLTFKWSGAAWVNVAMTGDY